MSFWTIFLTLPTPIQEVLLGGAGNYLGGVAGELTIRLLDNVGYQVKKKFQEEPQKIAVNKAFAQALYETFSRFTDNQNILVHYISIFGEWTSVEIVAGELGQLIDPRPESKLDLELLAGEFKNLGYDPNYLGLPVEFEEIVSDFAQFFFDAAAANEEELKGVIEIKLLRGIIGQLTSVNLAALRTAAATENMADDVEDIKSLIHDLVEGAKTEKDLHESIQSAIEQGFTGQHELMENIASSLQKVGYDVGFDAQGFAEIVGGHLEGNQLITPEVIRELQNEISLLRQAIVGHAPSDEELDFLESKFRTHIIQWFQDLTFQGMMRVARAVSLPLEDIYVELRAVAEVPENADSFSAEERRLLIEWDAKDESEEKDLMLQLDTLRRERWGRGMPERKSIADAINDENHNAFVILGDPGSGKSTLLHFLALIYAKGEQALEKAFGKLPKQFDLLPIFIPLAAFDDMRRQKPDLTLLEFLPLYYEQRRMLPGLSPLFQRALQSGRALLLFDGLDEVLDATTRKYVTGQVSALINQFRGFGVQYIISSRFVGYREAPLPGKIPHLSVMDFGQSEIETFVHQWTFAFEKALANGIETTETIRLARKLERDLLKDVNSTPGVRKLAANPLMLTMLALMRRQVGRLPHRRIILYERYVSTLIENWIEARTFGERQDPIDILELHEVETILIPLALWLQQNKPSGTVSKRELLVTLKNIYLQKAGLEINRASTPQQEIADKQARRFLNEMRHMAGLIIERGHDAFGFLHLTFQEYFVGRALAQLDDLKRLEISKNHLHDPRWREPFLLCCGRLGVVENRQSQVTSFVTQILERPDETESVLHRKLLLALAIASDDVNISPGLLERLGEKVSEIIPSYIPILDTQIIELIGGIASNEKSFFLKYLSPTLQPNTGWWSQIAICNGLANYLYIPEILKIVLDYLDHNVSEVREAAITALANVAASNDKVLRSILSRTHFNTSDREAGIKALSKYAKTNDLVKNTIIGYLQFRCLPNMSLIVDAATPLIESEPRVRAGMINCFKYDNSGASQAISKYVAQDPILRDQVISLIEETEVKQVQKSALKALSHSVIIDKKAKNIVFNALKHENDEVQRGAFYALQNLMETDLTLRSKLTHLFFQPPIKWQAINAVQTIATKDNTIREEIFSQLSHEDEFVRLAAIESLAQVINIDDVTRNKIIDCLDDESVRVRGEAATYLSKFVDEGPILNKFMEMLSSDSWEIRQIIVEAFEDILSNSVTYDLLVQSLHQFNTTDDLLHDGLKAFQDLLNYDEKIKQLALEALFDERKEVRIQAIESLLIREKEDISVRRKIAQSLTEFDEDMRYVIGVRGNKIFSELIEFKEIRQLAIEWLDTKDRMVRTYILVAFTPFIERDTEARNILIENLRSDRESGITFQWILANSSEIILIDELRNLLFDYMISHLGTERLFYEFENPYIEAIRKLVNMDDELQQYLTSILSREDVTSHDNLFHNAAYILSSHIQDNAEIRGLFLTLAQEKPRKFQYGILNGLARLVESDSEVQTLFIENLNYGDYHARRFALDSLAKIIEVDEDIPGKILSIAIDHDEEVDLRKKALNALVVRLPYDTKIKDQMVECMDDPWFRISVLAIESLSIFVDSDEQIRDAIINKFNSRHWIIRAAAMESLLHWSKLPESNLWNLVVNWLRADFKNSNTNRDMDHGKWESKISLLAKTVGNNLPEDKRLQERLIGWLKEPSFSVRLGAVRAFSSWPGNLPEQFIPLIIEAIKDKRGLESYPARLKAASFLINNLNPTFSQNAIEVCLEALTYGTNSWDNLEDSWKIRKEAILILSKLEPTYYDERIYSSLLNVLHDNDAEVCNAAYLALVKLAEAKEIQLTS